MKELYLHFLRNLSNAFLMAAEWTSITGPCHQKPHYISKGWNVPAVYNNKESHEGELQFKSDPLPKTLKGIIMEGESLTQGAILKSWRTWAVMSLHWKDPKRRVEDTNTLGVLSICREHIWLCSLLSQWNGLQGIITIIHCYECNVTFVRLCIVHIASGGVQREKPQSIRTNIQLLLFIIWNGLMLNRHRAGDNTYCRAHTLTETLPITPYGSNVI